MTKMIKLSIAVGFLLVAGPVGLIDPYSGRADGSGPSIGLSLFFENSLAAPITLVGDSPRYLQEIDILATVSTATDQGIDPIIHGSEFSSLDWAGIQLVEEDWRQGVDGVTFTRQRFYRGAKWMERSSAFLVIPTNDAGHPVGWPLFAFAGSDNTWTAADDGFVRRFTARQIATGCPAVGDCTGAAFTAQGLVQLRDALHAEKRDRTIPLGTTRLRLEWSEQIHSTRTVNVSHTNPSEFPFGYGFRVSYEAASTPANGSYYVPGEQVSFRATFTDGNGNRLHPFGWLPTYGEFVRGEVTSGLRYHDFTISPTLYYALKHREANMETALSGPIDKLRLSHSVVTPDQLPLPQQIVATVGLDGYSGVAQEVPSVAILLAGLFDPAAWDTPVPDVVNFTIPDDALPGTYVAAIKGRRYFGGEALNRAATTTIQVGTLAPSTFTAKTGRCETCHKGPSDFGKILHGGTDRRACFACHGPLFFEPDAALDIRVHTVHDRSDRFPADITNCAVCHLTPPNGPARGVLGS